MHQHKTTVKKAQASANWTGALGRKRTKRTLTLESLHPPGGDVNGKLLTGNGGLAERKISACFGAEIERREKMEKWLREEVRDSRKILLSLYKWGVTVLAGLESSLYFVRRDAANHLDKIHALPAYGTVPLGRWLAGTGFLTMIAFIFCHLVSYTIRRHVGYRSQLIGMKPSYSGIIENGLAGGKLHTMHFWLFYAFPAFDFVLWFYFRVAGNFTVHW